MRIIKTGSTRIVILIGNYAIKIPRVFTKVDNKFYGKVIGILEGWLANRHEYKWSRSNIYDFLCPVEYPFLFSFIIVMRRATPISDDTFMELEKYNFSYEHKTDSYGKLSNKIVVIDYG